ncbi:MAG TPA: DUF6017 domain-containing protein [Alphaproteobacteria bacterium]|nr:DUF6017 domain-containing protein [Alphaproteobacteria bacterium]
MLDYFYGGQAEQFSFYRIPKALFTDERFRSISAEAKVLYGILLDRMSLSQKNGWLDDTDRVYIIFTTQDIMDAIDCADQKATKLLSELEQKAGLIERKRQGLGKPNLIYVKNFIGSSESRFKNRENHDSGAVKITNQESLKSRCSNTDFSNTDYSDTDSLLFTSFRGGQSRETNRSEERQEYREIILENIGYEYLREEYRYDQDTLDEILELMVDVVCTTKDTVRISGDDKPAEVVKGRLLKLDLEHIRFVLDSLRENTTKIRNIKQYLLATLYNAPMTISNHFRSLVNHDMANGLI